MSTQLLTPEDLAKRWAVPRSSIWAMSRNGVIPNVKIGRHYRYRLDAIEAFELSGGMDGAT